jgi:hypothetical protein
MARLPRKVAVLSPTTIQFVEKMAALVKGTTLIVVGPPNRDAWGWNSYERRLPEWEAQGLKVELRQRAYKDIDFSEFDLLIETFETFGMDPSWVENCTRYECPTVVKACWTRDPWYFRTGDYFNKAHNLPVLLEMPAHVANWEMSGFSDVNLLFNPVGDWWFNTPWSGRDGRAVMVLSGKDQWRLKQHHGLDLVDRLKSDFPGRIHVHDGLVDYKTAQQMADMLAGARVFLALDEPYGQGERPLSLVFTEALSAGCPVAVRDLPNLSYRHFIDGNGIAANNYEALRDYVGSCLNDHAFASQASARSRAIAHRHFAMETLRQSYATIFERARERFHRRHMRRELPVHMSRFSTLHIEKPVLT